MQGAHCECHRKTQGDITITEKSLLNGKRVLIVDDESDVLETLKDLLPMCDVVKASFFEEAKDLLETQYFHIAILDIMGVDGYKLLEIANKGEVIAVMLTAHALSPEHTIKSYKEGAASYIPKEEMGNITTFLNDIFEAKEKGKNFCWRLLTGCVTIMMRNLDLIGKRTMKNSGESSIICK